MVNIFKTALKKLSPTSIYGQLRKMNVVRKGRPFKKKYPETKIFIKQAQVLYSQHSQDYIVYNHFFKNKKEGVFCDVGGNHPLTINNTLYFEEMGWSGTVFEPLPLMKPLWEKHRKAKLFPFGASDKNDEVVFSVVKNVSGWEDMLSFVKSTDDGKTYKHETEQITIQVRPLKEVFKDEHITHIDYMSIDVEGHELNVLKGIDFSAVTISVLTIENNPPGCSIIGDEKIRDIMFKNNYLLWGRIHSLDDIYVHKDFIKTINLTE